MVLPNIYILFDILDFRFFAICFPMKVKTICTTQRAKLVVPLLWVIGFIIPIPNTINYVSIH